jgi:hypothetical protein
MSQWVHRLDEFNIHYKEQIIFIRHGEGRVVLQNYGKNKTTISKKEAFVDNIK